MTSSALRTVTEAEYLQSEETSPVRREYVWGFVYDLHGDEPRADAGAASRHGLICLNIGATLHRPALDQNCRLYLSDMRVRIPQPGGVRYYSPDLALTCDPVDDGANFLATPCFVVEVLSPSTQDLDRREKLLAYTAMPSLRGYLLVDTAGRATRLYTRMGDDWAEQYEEGEGTLTVPCLDVPLSLHAIYEGVVL